jgi:uroporphyrinogen decarboxylase
MASVIAAASLFFPRHLCNVARARAQAGHWADVKRGKMSVPNKLMLRALAGETLPVPPVWMMRQAGRYLPEYRATRAKAGSFLDLCYTPELAVEVTLQPIRRYGFDAAILFADILLVPQALGLDLRFVEGEGPRLSTVTNAADLAALKPVEAIHDTLSPVYETVARLAEELPAETTLIGFAGAPWTVATYMINGRGSADHAEARRMMYGDPATFDALIDRVTEATIAYLLRQIAAGAEVVKIFDSWAGALPGLAFARYAIEPAQRIVAAIRAEAPHVPVIGFPRGAGGNYAAFAEATGCAAVALDTGVDPAWAARAVQTRVCVQGNLDPLLLVTGGEALDRQTRATVEGFAGGPHIFNLGHGITPDADPANVDRMLRAIRG